MNHAPSSTSEHNRLPSEAMDAAHRGTLLVAIGALYTLTFRQHLHGKRWLVMAILFSLPAGLALLIRATVPDAPPIILEFLLGFLLVPHALLPIVALAYAAGIIQDEQEEQTLTYLLIRPIPRWAIYAVKLLATVTTTALLTTVFTALTYLAIYSSGQTEVSHVPSRCLKAIAINDLSVMTYCCLFGLISLLSKRAMIVGIIYIVIVEGIAANQPFGVRLMTVIYYARSIAFQCMDFILTRDGRSHNVAADTWQFANTPPGDLTSIATCIEVLVAASLVSTAIAARICARREFYVKTPEGG